MTGNHPFARIGAIVVGAALLAATVAVILWRGPWYDEFYTFYVTRPGVGIAALSDSWLADNHPPLFYALSWATGWLGETVQARRFINLPFLAGGLAALAALWRARGEWRELAIPYAIALASFPSALRWAAELRSNYLVYIATAAALAALTALMIPRERAVTRREGALLGAALAIACNVHLVATVINLSIAFVFGLRLLLRRDWQRARLLVLVTVIAALPLAATMALQFASIEANTRSFWIPGGFDAARWVLEHELVFMLGANPPLSLAAAGGLAAPTWDAWRKRRWTPPLALVVTIGAGTALAIAALITVHMTRPIIIDRYLVGLNPAMAMVMAIGLAALAERCRGWGKAGLFALVTAGTLWAIAANTRATIDRQSWNGTARLIAATVRECPAALVHADTRWNAAVIAMPPAENRAVVPLAYRMVAAQNGINLQSPEARTMARGCPTLFWAEHVPSLDPGVTAIAAALRRDGYPVGRAELRRVGSGWVLFTWPAKK